MNEPNKELIDTMRKGRKYGIDPTLTYLNKRLVTLPEPPRCTCRQYEGDDPKCPIHGKKDGQG